MSASTYHIHLTGIVQGVGFRPAVYRMAVEQRLTGYVHNANDGLHVVLNADRATAQLFLAALIDRAPRLSRITGHSLTGFPHYKYADFSVVESDEAATVTPILTPDLSLCDDCRRELHDPGNRRFHYPFITCTHCGPRYSILDKLPYDRTNTSMARFAPCPACQAEYGDVRDRRYFSQTNSCDTCGVRMSIFNSARQCLHTGNSNALAAIEAALDQGLIVAVKGIGGYQLLCDATNKEVILRLRHRKNRPTKPFAVLCQGLEAARRFACVSEEESRWLRHPAAPIVLLQATPETSQRLCMEAIAPGLDEIGLMLPNSPLLDLIATRLCRPLVCTSGNASGAPILFRDEEALQQLADIADILAIHDREILMPQDDSVLRITREFQKCILLRRGRGMAPLNITYEPAGRKSILATGALMKSSFALLYHNHTCISQYLGDTNNYETQGSFVHAQAHLLAAFKPKPEVIVTDKHPAYFTTQLGAESAAKTGVSHAAVQHHMAHFAAVLAENTLIQQTEPVLGVIWDGAGLGDDGAIWGGEFFLYADRQMTRATHFPEFPVLLGDKMAREPRLSALAICRDLPAADERLAAAFTPTEWRLYRNLLQQGEPIRCTSVGRLFDAVACLLGGCDRQSFEGEAALHLETAAQRSYYRQDANSGQGYFIGLDVNGKITTDSLLAGILQDLADGTDRDTIAAKFHYALVGIVEAVAKQFRCRRIAFSGGVFQNALLTDLLRQLLGHLATLYFHRQLPPNDENISFGQLVFFDNNINNLQQQTHPYVLSHPGKDPARLYHA
jgi:hydrogenase maturation protein HypF